MFTLERAHQLLRQQGLGIDDNFQVSSHSRQANAESVSLNPGSALPAFFLSLFSQESSFRGPFRLALAVVIGTTIGSLLASLVA